MSTVKSGLNVLPVNIKKRAVTNINKHTENVDTDKVLSLVNAFNWTTSKEGYEYWYAVHKKYFLNQDVTIPKPLK